MVGNEISKLRQNKKLTQQELAIKIGITRASLSHYEKNRREPDYDILKQFARFFGVTTDYLLGYTNDSEGVKIEDSFIKSHIKLFIIALGKQNVIYESGFLEYIRNISSCDYCILFNMAADLHVENGKPLIKLKKISLEMTKKIDELQSLPSKGRKTLVRILADDL